MKAGLIPLTVTVDGVPLTRGALPMTIFAALIRVWEQVEVVPQLWVVTIVDW